jgi:hypothetical protein
MGGVSSRWAVHRFTGILTRKKIMGNWVPLNEDDVLSQMTKRERDDFAKVSVGDTVTDRLVPILANLVSEVRGYIGSHHGNTLSADVALIPIEFRAKAVSIAVWRILTSIPGYSPGDARKLEYEKADAFFISVAKGTIRPAPADDAIPSGVPNEKPVPSPRINARKRRFSLDQQQGI